MLIAMPAAYAALYIPAGSETGLPTYSKGNFRLNIQLLKRNPNLRLENAKFESQEGNNMKN